MFTKGTRVQVVDEAVAHEFRARVYNGQVGTVVYVGRNPAVRMDGDPDPAPWHIPEAALRRIHTKKVKVD